MPKVLLNEADWTNFQTELDRATVTILGRRSHEATPNPSTRMRVVVSSRVYGLELRDRSWWWNPSRVSVRAMLHSVLPSGGRIAVPGGRAVYDMFLGVGFDAFHLSRKRGALVPGGIPVFSAVDSESRTPEEILETSGLVPDPELVLDVKGPVTLQVWRG